MACSAPKELGASPFILGCAKYNAKALAVLADPSTPLSNTVAPFIAKPPLGISNACQSDIKSCAEKAPLC